ncbi:MAG: hypothetical protein HY748_06650 [Elusimicrobia bacterium]|nr:hypothetical protein [Elusimicrobiota bacterium]
MALFPLLIATVLSAALPGGAQEPRRAGEPAEPDFSIPASSTQAPPVSGARRLWLTAHDAKGRRMDFRELISFIGRADARTRGPGLPPLPPAEGERLAPSGTTRPGATGLAVYAAGSLVRAPKFELLETAGGAALVWEGPERVQASLPWPVPDDGFSTVWIDKVGEGYADRDTINLNEEIALTQHRRLQETLRWRTAEAIPIYVPGDKTRRLLASPEDLLGEAQRERDPQARAKAFDAVLRAVSLAWQKVGYEHGLQVVKAAPSRDSLRFGLTLDEKAAGWSAHAEWIAEMVEKSGANWVRLVFRANPHDFTYGGEGSFGAYDAFVSGLSLRGLKIMACVLDTAQWPRTLTPEAYAARTAALVRRYGDRVRSWEVGAEINGDWLGGSKAPLSPERVFEIYAAGVQAVKAADPALETVATLYWWEGTAPDAEHSLFGWLERFVPLGFGKDLDVVSLSLQPEDNPVGMAFDGIFQAVHEKLPRQKLMLGSFGYVEGEKLAGYWWLDPADVDGARKDLLILYNAASCAQPNSLCGGYWWQTLDQMLRPPRRTTDLFLLYKRSLYNLGR